MVSIEQGPFHKALQKIRVRLRLPHTYPYFLNNLFIWHCPILIVQGCKEGITRNKGLIEDTKAKEV